ncbi:MAG: glycosyltransferase [Nanoarchaeota archaeon]|nr:glycosyltransferase [Nanoarchaeota archaeon]
MISIIITAYKEEKTIGKAIEFILKNNLSQEYELLVFAPDKKTLDVAKEYSKKNEFIKVLKDKGEGKPSALNMAFKLAKGEIIVFTDGDVHMSKKALRFLLEPFKNKKIGAVSGRPVSRDSRKKMLGFWSHLLTDIAHLRRKKAPKLNKRFYCSGYLYAMRKGIVNEIPKETLSDDGFISYLIHSKGYKIDYAPEAEVYVRFPNNFKDWIIQKKRSAGGYNQIKLWTKKEIRSFSKESSGIFQVLIYPKTLREFFYTFLLIFARIYLWILIFIDINIRKKEFKKIWLRVESTK